MKKSAVFSVMLFTILLLFFSCSNSKLTEDKAKKAVETLLAKGTELPDNSPITAQLIEWQGLIQISETEMNGKATIQHHDGRMHCQFIFHKSSESKWILDKIQFKSENGWAWWNQDVFQKVE